MFDLVPFSNLLNVCRHKRTIFDDDGEREGERTVPSLLSILWLRFSCFVGNDQVTTPLVSLSSLCFDDIWGESANGDGGRIGKLSDP